jgi:hypothetical protein
MRTMKLVFVVCLLAFVGCGPAEDKWKKGRLKTVPASGTVTMNGQPVADATVIFAPTSPTGIGSAAKSDSSGKFVLSTYPDEAGAVPGSYMVMVNKIEVPPLPGANAPEVSSAVYAKHLVPKRYSDPLKSGLKVEIPQGDAGISDIKLELKE